MAALKLLDLKDLKSVGFWFGVSEVLLNFFLSDVIKRDFRAICTDEVEDNRKTVKEGLTPFVKSLFMFLQKLSARFFRAFSFV